MYYLQSYPQLRDIREVDIRAVSSTMVNACQYVSSYKEEFDYCNVQSHFGNYKQVC